KVQTLVKAKAVKHGSGKHPDAKIVTPGHIGFDEYCKNGGYQLLKDCLEGRKQREEVIATMEHSGLRGLGGAGFPAGRKWRIVGGQPEPRLMAVNIDEGEPGTF